MLLSLFVLAGLSSHDLQRASHEALTDSLAAVTISADKGLVVSKTDTVSVCNSFSVSDILLHSPAFHVGDNGGQAGLKTVSLRGMGSAHTSVYFDGVRVGNVQSGQNDLGMIGPENISSVVVDYAQNSVSFNTARPVFKDGSTTGAVRISYGSFGTWQPSALLGFRLDEKLSLSVNASGLVSKGDFGYGDGLSRKNNDIRQGRAGADLFGLTEGGDYHLKAYYNASDRGTPGSTDWLSEDRQTDRNIFLQGVFRQNVSNLYTTRLSGKASWDAISYTSSWGDSRYAQTELQLNSSHDFHIAEWWGITFAADLQWDDLRSDSYNAARLTAFSSFGSSFRFSRLSADFALEYSGAYDRGTLYRNAWSPSASIRLDVTDALKFVAFARRAYRIPTFNELYYVGYGNPRLRPEDAWLTDVGMEYRTSLGVGWTVKINADGFYNILKDKITSAPTPEDPNIWQPYNIGKVRSVGADAEAGIEHKGEWKYALNVKYSLISAVDMTVSSSTYGQQIPYVARHSVNMTGTLAWRGWTFEPVCVIRGGRKDGYGEMPAWNTLDLHFSKLSGRLGKGTVIVRLSLKNIADCRYEVVSGYPMPGRSVIGGIEYKF